MDWPELHLLTVFAGDGCWGNGTSIVLSDRIVDLAAAQRLATILSTPDSGFLYPDADGSGWSLVSFSPVELLAFCTQTLLASGKVLIERAKTEPKVEIYVPQIDRRVPVEGHHCGDPDTYWTGVSKRDISVECFEATPPGWHDLEKLSLRTMRINTGRPRVVCKLDSAEMLLTYRSEPDEIMAFCHKVGVNGLCLFVQNPNGRLLARVFTTSLAGQEDRGTGGAIACIPPYLEACGELNGDLPVVTVRQGGSDPNAGLLLLRSDAMHVWVGSRVQSISKGRLEAAALLTKKGWS